MDEHRLKCFVAVYEEGSVSAAAKRMHITQPPLSILLRKLEAELGVSLFDRSEHRLVPTTTGALFYLRAQSLLANLQTMRRELLEAEQGARGTVHIGCATAASLFVIPSLMEDLRDEGLSITVHVHEGESTLSLQKLRERGLDLIISRSEYQAPELEKHAILDEPLQVMLPPATHRRTAPACGCRTCGTTTFYCTARPWAPAFQTWCCAPVSRSTSRPPWCTGAARPCPCC